MTPAHLHLVLVHAPVVAPAFALALVLLAAVRVRADAGPARGALPIDEAAVEERAELALVLSWVAAVAGPIPHAVEIQGAKGANGNAGEAVEVGEHDDD